MKILAIALPLVLALTLHHKPVDVGGYSADKCYKDTSHTIYCHQNGDGRSTDGGGGSGGG